MRIAVIGNCQIVGIANALISSGIAEVQIMDITVLKTHKQTKAAAKSLPSFDWIVVQCLEEINARSVYAPFRIKRIQTITPNIIIIPAISFSGFHPDCTAIRGSASRVVRTPAGEYSSALIAAAYSLRISTPRTERLFNAYIYQRIGYFDEVPKARAFLMAHSQGCGMDLTKTISEWLSRGVPFMHTFNHPVAFAVESVARLAAKRMGIPASSIFLDKDNLAKNTVWPVYPEIAKQLGVAGSLEFKVAGADTRISLREMIEGSYEAYSRSPDAVFNTLDIARCRTILSAELVNAY